MAVSAYRPVVYVITLLYGAHIGIVCKAEVCTEGYQVRQGDFWSVCQKGRLNPVACVSSDGDRVEEGSHYQTRKFVFACDRNPQDTKALKLIPVACVSNGRTVDIGATFSEDQNRVLRCARAGGDELRIETVGCLGDDGLLLAEGGTVVRDGVAYTCRMPAGGGGAGAGVELSAKACLFENREYAADSVVESSSLWYRCERTPKPAGLVLSLKGCVDNGTRYQIGKQFTDYYFLYECQAQPGSALRVGIGCIERYPNGTVAQYKPGDRWLVGMADNRYQIMCKREGLTIRRLGVACYYKTKDGEGMLDGGCMRKVGFQILQCMPAAPRTPNVRIRVTENPTQADWTRLRGLGLREC